MRKIGLAIAAALALFATLSLSPNRAEAAAAMPVPTGLYQALQSGDSLLQETAYVCRRVWRCGYWGCGWQRVCEYVAPRFYRPYRPYRYYRW